MRPRSGTNYLSDLLCLHPDCAAADPILEDYLVHHADILALYVDTVRQRWRPEWGVGDADASRLLRSLGDGLVGFLAARTNGRRVVAKTPSVRNLDLFFTLFPTAQLLILVRDGRDEVESMVRSFGVNREWATRRWAEAARTILDFDRANKDSGRNYLIVKYEDLWQNLGEEAPRIFSFLDLASDAYDFAAAAELPIRGSSEHTGQVGQGLDWTPTVKPADFKPVKRWRNWSPSRHARFNWIAGVPLVGLGYALEQVNLHPHCSAGWNRVLDARWLAGGALRV
ncbi:MAG: sulfotransferase, partial [Gammaproteobacteria bacterium]|nr:sulfotransferase [Gammaproteobacteria bacterium]